MKSLILIAAIIGCSLATPEPEPQFKFNQFNQGRYNPYGRYNNRYPYNQYNQYNQGQYNPGRYQPQYYSTTFAPPVTSGGSAEATPAPVVASVAPAQAYVDGKIYRTYDDANAQTLRLENDQTPDGAFQYSFETSNGIAAQAVGNPRNLGGVPPNVPTVVQGSYSWVAPGGRVISVSYVADENGYRAVGDSIPTPPPIPDAILRSIEYNRQHSPSSDE